MNLVYRGIVYPSSDSAIATQPSEQSGTFLGQAFKMQQQPLSPAMGATLHYRGAVYRG